MTAISIAHLGPTGTYAEMAAAIYQQWLWQTQEQPSELQPFPSIGQTIEAVARQTVDLAVVPVENSIQGGVTMTLDGLWQLDDLQIQQALVLPIEHTLISEGKQLADLKTVYSHPQALAQCQQWLIKHLSQVQQIATHSTTEAIAHLKGHPEAGAIASQRAAKLYQIPTLASQINDYPDNCTRFWVLGLTPSRTGKYLSLAFSVPANIPGALVTPLRIFAERQINLSRIESRPTKRLLGEYLFYIDLEGSLSDARVASALQELSNHTAILKTFGNYDLIPIDISSSLLCGSRSEEVSS